MNSNWKNKSEMIKFESGIINLIKTIEFNLST